MRFLFHIRQSLATKLSWLVAVSAVVSLLLLAVYFDSFLRNSFQAATNERLRHAAQRVVFHFQALESDLRQGVQVVADDHRLVASLQLLNKYEGQGAYNQFLIDEEKKSLAADLLDQLKASFHTDMALYDARGHLVAFAIRQPAGFQLGYRTERNGYPQLMGRLESELSERQLANLQEVDAQHVDYYGADELRHGSVITYHRMGDAVGVKAHINVVDGADVVGQVELSRRVGASVLNDLSSQLGVELHQGFEAPSGHVPIVVSPDVEAISRLTAIEQGTHYVAALQRETVGGTAYLTIRLDRAKHTQLVLANRWQFLLLLAAMSIGTLFWMRWVARRNLSVPLSALMQQIREVERGHYQTPPPDIATGDEWQQISESVTRLAVAVQEREAALERARHEQEYLSNHDALTGLPNRRYFSQRLEHALDLARRRQSKLAVLFMDLDQFKLVNDTQGHDVGDALLVQVAERLKAPLRAGDTLARIGGDEFNLLLEDLATVKDAEWVAEKLIAALRAPFEVLGRTIETTISIGVAVYPRDGVDSVALLKNADLAVYKTKDNGRNGFSFYSEDLAREARQRSETMAALTLALEEPVQFHMVYQPKCDAQTGQVVSAEALIRWTRPGVGLVSPVQFIPLAEETGQIVPIGDWVIERVCRDVAALRRLGIELDHVSLNVSNVQLHTHPVGDVIQAAVQRHGLLPRHIELEITESYIAQDTQAAIDRLHRFRELGYQLAIDDFGTGYSSMSSLQKLPFTRLKIDKSFVDGLPLDEDSVVITRAIVGLARSFGLHITAEGVERQEQWDLLRKLGCSEIQGYVYAKPMPLNELVQFIDAQTAAQAALARI